MGKTVENKAGYIRSITIIGILFFIFGFVTWLNGILIPYLKIACELNNFESLLVAFAFYISYFIMALPSSWVLRKTGFKKGMMLGLLIMSAGTLLFIPAAKTRVYPVFLTGLFIMGVGLSILQTASNPYITIIGPIESAARRISIMGICNKVAGALAPLVLSYFILHDGDSLVEKLKGLNAIQKAAELDILASRVIGPYIVMSVILAGLAVMVRYSSLPEIEEKNDEEKDIYQHEEKSIFQYPHLWFGVIALFFYVGVEVIAGDTIIRYGISLGIDLSTAAGFTSLTLAAMIAGYLAGVALIPKILTQRKALALSALTGIIFSIAAIFTKGYHSVLFIALLGLANALIWPAIWPLAIDGLGKHTKTGSALLIMAIAGGATLPLIYGKLADHFNTQQAYWICVPCYLVILFFAIWGYKSGKKNII